MGQGRQAGCSSTRKEHPAQVIDVLMNWKLVPWNRQAAAAVLQMDNTRIITIEGQRINVVQWWKDCFSDTFKSLLPYLTVTFIREAARRGETVAGVSPPVPSGTAPGGWRLRRSRLDRLQHGSGFVALVSPMEAIWNIGRQTSVQLVQIYFYLARIHYISVLHLLRYNSDLIKINTEFITILPGFCNAVLHL